MPARHEPQWVGREMSAMDWQQSSFGEWLRRRRRALDLTQTELARQIGCSVVTLRKLEAETRRPSKQIAERLAVALGVAPDAGPAFLRFARGDPFGQPILSPASGTPNHNLPVPLNRFVGRETEIVDVTRLLTGARLVTLTGTGGAGKTRLAEHVARQLLAQFPDGVWLASLAPLTDELLLPGAIAALFDLKEETTHSTLEILVLHLRSRRLMLVLDGCEHLVRASARLAEALLKMCPGVTILATSREPLVIPGEHIYPLASLAFPDGRRAQSGEALLAYDSVRLFIERGTEAHSNFTLTDANGDAIAQICQQLDGLPLGIELAAAQLRSLPVEQVAMRLDDSWQRLPEGNRAALPRHRTLQASLEWSYALLTEPEQSLLRRLAVFASSWSLPAAEAVGASQPESVGEVLVLLTRLLDKSLVLVETQAGQPRYRMLDTIRHFARTRLAASGEAEAAGERLAHYYLAQIQASESARRGSLPLRPGQLHGLDLEHDNLRAALNWCRTAPTGAEVGLRLASALDWFWFSVGHWREAQAWLEGALAHPRAAQYPSALAQALESLGTILALQGDYAAGQAQLARSLRLFQELGNRSRIAWLLNRMGWLAREHGDTVAARARLEESLELYRALGDPAGVAWSSLTLSEVAETADDSAGSESLLNASLATFEALHIRLGVAWAHNHLGHLAQLQGEVERAHELHTASLQLFSELGESLGVASARYSLGETALAAGDLGQAEAQLSEAARLFRNLGDRAGLAACLAALADATAAERPADSAHLWGLAEALRQSLGAREPPTARVRRRELMAQARAQIGEAGFAQAWDAGRTASVEKTIRQRLDSTR
jgi:predicted ATPase/transcriptional regulator with XRE-family HTH domain